MISYCIKNLEQLEDLLKKIPLSAYTHKSQLLSGASIGQHFRHLIEFYKCALHGLETKRVCYDNRERLSILENSLQEAQTTLSTMIIVFNFLQDQADEALVLEVSFSNSNGHIQELNSSFFRELAYCIEHSIHHQALVKVCLIEQGLEHLAAPNFGVAPSTIRFASDLRGQN